MMDQENLHNRLKQIITTYLNKEDADDLLSDISKDTARYILAEVDQKKQREITPEDKDIIKDIIFYFG